uniref:Uncharacterized protein n=1 Tax=Shewanella sp. (strain MR-7) TaxID=60481 RepID=Q0HUF2_SHESR
MHAGTASQLQVRNKLPRTAGRVVISYRTVCQHGIDLKLSVSCTSKNNTLQRMRDRTVEQNSLALQGAFVQITVKGPRFWCQEDEDKFFEWIYSLPNYQSVTGRGLDLIIELNEPLPQSTINQLFVLFKRWELDFNALAPLKNINKSHIAWVNEFFK